MIYMYIAECTTSHDQTINLPKRDELLLRTVLALPKAYAMNVYVLIIMRSHNHIYTYVRNMHMLTSNPTSIIGLASNNCCSISFP